MQSLCRAVSTHFFFGEQKPYLWPSFINMLKLLSSSQKCVPTLSTTARTQLLRSHKLGKHEVCVQYVYTVSVSLSKPWFDDKIRFKISGTVPLSTKTWTLDTINNLFIAISATSIVPVSEIMHTDKPTAWTVLSVL